MIIIRRYFGKIISWFRNTRFRVEYYRKLKTLKRLHPPRQYPHSKVLRSDKEYKEAIAFLRSNGIITDPTQYKNWDNLAALSIILKHAPKNAKILDAGGEFASVILPWLSFYGYKNLKGINLSFKKITNLGPITYEFGDITKTRFQDNSFDVITCISVIEHGVDLERYFKEVSRILKPHGLLFTSTDYWCEKISTKNKVAYNVKVKIYDKQEIIHAVSSVKQYNLRLMGNLDLDCKDQVVKWRGLDYTFMYFTMQKE